MRDPGAPAVGQITAEGRKRFEAKRRAEGRRAEKVGVRLERLAIQAPELGAGEGEAGD